MLGVFLDTETNGLDPFKHKIIEIAFKIVDLELGTEVAVYESVVALAREDWKMSNPESLSINGFSWEMTLEGRDRSRVAEELSALFKAHTIIRGEAIFICQNPSFDRAFFLQVLSSEEQDALCLPYHWLDLASMYWALAIGHIPRPWVTGCSKDQIAASLHLPSEEYPHRAMQGVDHLLQCYEHLVGFPGLSTQ
jgi:DNA polymerase-3 subunit epsilon/oligoribonuclease